MKRLLFLLCVGLLSVNIVAQTRWEYPIRPGSETWRNFTTHKQMIDACRIPASTLSIMSTSELLQAWEDFPLKFDVIAFDSPQQGFKAQKQISDALRQLLARKDAGEVVLKRFREARAAKEQIYAKQHPTISINDYWMLRILVSQPEIRSRIGDLDDNLLIEKQLYVPKGLRKTATDLDIRTPRGTYVPNVVRSDGADDPFEPWVFDIAGTDAIYRQNYPQATIISSSTRTYNCHSYAWADGYSNRCWINTPGDDLYWTDGSYDSVPENVSTKVSYSGDHSATTTSTAGAYISKWGSAPLMLHAANYVPIIYYSPSQYFRRSVDVPQDQPTIASALSSAVSGQTVSVSGSQALSSDVAVPFGITLLFVSGSSLSFNGYHVVSAGGTIVDQSGGTLICVHLKQSGVLQGLFPTIQGAINYGSPGQTVELKSSTYNESVYFTGRSSITLIGQGQGNTTLNSSISVTNSAYISILDLTLSGPLCANYSTETYFGHATVTGTTMALDCGGTLNEIGGVTANNIGASFGLSAYGGTGDLYNSTVSNGDCAAYLTNYASYNIGTTNLFCENGLDIYAGAGAFAYAISNDYSRPLPSSVYGNVFVTGVNGVCGQLKAPAISYDRPTDQLPAELQVLDEKYLALLRKIQKAKKEGTYDPRNYALEHRQLIGEYRNLIRNDNDKGIIKAALGKLSHLFNALRDRQGFASYITAAILSGTFESIEPYLKRHLIWNSVDRRDFENSLRLAEEVQSSGGITEDLVVEMLYERGLIYKHYLGDNTRANELYGSIVSHHPSHPLSAFAAVEMNVNPSSEFMSSALKLNLSVKPSSYQLRDNYPNPFNPSTQIRYELLVAGNVSLVVYDVLGREVANLTNGYREAGYHSATWNATDQASGVYFARFVVTNADGKVAYSKINKLMLIR